VPYLPFLQGICHIFDIFALFLPYFWVAAPFIVFGKVTIVELPFKVFRFLEPISSPTGISAPNQIVNILNRSVYINISGPFVL